MEDRKKVFIAYQNGESCAMHFDKNNIDKTFMLTICVGIIDYMDRKGMCSCQESIEEIDWAIEQTRKEVIQND